MSQSIEKLNQHIKEYQEILQCKRRLDVVKKEIHRQNNKLKHLKTIVKYEHQDVLDLEKFSLNQLFSTLLVNKQAQLEKERQEYLIAALNFNECQEVVDLLKFEYEILLQKLANESVVVRQFDLALSEFQIKEDEDTEKDIAELKLLNDDLKSLIKLKIEAQEAHEVVKELTLSFNKIIKALEQAKVYDNWGEFYKQRQTAKVKKKQYIDQAQAGIYQITKQFIFLRSELLDIEQFKTTSEQANDLIANFNLHYYNDLITDWINELKLNETIEYTLTTIETVAGIEKKLSSLVQKSESEYQAMLNKRAALVEKIGD